jgi:hypothetical protein
MNKKIMFLIFTLLMFLMVESVSADIWGWTTDYSFSLPGSSTYIFFSKTAYFDTFAWDILDASATELTLANAYTGTGTPVTSLVVKAVGCNVTFDKINEDNKIQFAVDGAGNITLGTFTSTPNTANASVWSYASGTIVVNSTAAETVLLDWTNPGGIPSGPGGTPSGPQPSPSPSAPPIPPIIPPTFPPTTIISPDNSWVLIVVAVVAVGLLFGVEKTRRKKKWPQKKGKQPKWSERENVW